MRDELKELKVGDEVAIFGGSPMSSIHIKRVTRFTKTQIITDGWSSACPEIRWNRGTGHEVGGSGSFMRRYIIPATDKHRAAAKREGALARAINLCDVVKLRKLSTEKLEKIVEILGD